MARKKHPKLELELPVQVIYPKKLGVGVYTAPVAVFANDLILPITNWMDKDGDFCGPDDAILCIAGMHNTWIHIELGGNDTVH